LITKVILSGSTWEQGKQITLTSSLTYMQSTQYTLPISNTVSISKIEIKDMKYYDGYLWLLLNQYYPSDDGVDSRGGLLSLDTSSLTDAVVSAGNLSGWTTDTDSWYHRPGITENGGDDTSVLGFSGPVHIAALTPRKLYIADDGAYYTGEEGTYTTSSGESRSGNKYKQRNRIGILDMTAASDALSFKDVAVQFDNGAVAGSSGFYIE